MYIQYMYIDFTSSHVSQALFTPGCLQTSTCTTTQQTASRQAGYIGPTLGRCLVVSGLSCQQTHLVTRRTRCACTVANTIRFISNFHKYRETSMFRHHLFPRNMTELRIWQSFGAAPPPPPSCAGTEDIYI